MSAIGPLSDSPYGERVRLPGRTVADAAAAVRNVLAAEGFGVLTEIDVQATMSAKLGVSTRPYLILGACNPPLALRALGAEPAVGLLMPCNVVITTDDDDTVVAVFARAEPILSVCVDPDMRAVAAEVAARLSRAAAALTRS